MESVILTTPLLVVLYAVALIFGLIGLKKQAGMVAPSLSVILCLLTSGYALLKGASLFEVAIVLLVFLAVNLLIFMRKGEK